MVEPFDGPTMPPKTATSEVQAWIQIHKIPPLFNNKAILEQFATRVGKVYVVELTRDFYRARVKLDLTKLPTCFVPLPLQGLDKMFLDQV
jgi:hypothetical protein